MMYSRVSRMIFSLIIISMMIAASNVEAQFSGSGFDANALGENILNSAAAPSGSGGSAIAPALRGCGAGSRILTGALDNLAGGIRGSIGLSPGTTGTVPTDDTQSRNANVKEQCLDAVAYSLARVMLADLTRRTVNHINTGNAGDPFWVDGNFIRRTVTNEVSKFARQELLNIRISARSAQYQQALYARDFARRLLTQQTNTASFTEQTRYTGPDQRTFSQSFIRGGGWAAWEAMVVNQNNNPFGQAIAISDKVAEVATQAQRDVETEAANNQGFVGQKICINPRGVAPNSPECKETQTVTPGTLLAEQAKIVSTSPVRQLELVDELNESLTLIFRSLFNQAITRGFSSLTRSNWNNSQSFSLSQGTGSIGNNGNFGDNTFWSDSLETINLEKDLPGIIQQQVRFIKKLEENNVALWTLVLNLDELDYCVPGPRANWKEEAAAKYNDFSARFLAGETRSNWEKLGDWLLLNGIGIDRRGNELGKITESFEIYIKMIEGTYENEEAYRGNPLLERLYNMRIDSLSETSRKNQYLAIMQQNNAQIAETRRLLIRLQDICIQTEALFREIRTAPVNVNEKRGTPVAPTLVLTPAQCNYSLE